MATYLNSLGRKSTRVCVLGSYHDYFDYVFLPDVVIGSRVIVPFGKKTRVGVVIGPGSCADPKITLKEISVVVDNFPLIPQELLDLCLWISNYYQAPLSTVLKVALPKKYRDSSEPLDLTYPLADPRGSVKQGSDDLLTEPRASASGAVSQSAEVITLNNEQSLAALSITQALGHYQSFLLYGVTGSGKTEVYFEAIAAVIKLQQQALVIVPEIGLTPILLARFKARFPNVHIGIVHSGISDKQRHLIWQQSRANQVDIILGTRSAIFTPLTNLGIVIVDEEHDLSLKQQDNLRYSARDVALMRAHKAHIPIVLGSATPSLESLYNAERGKHHILYLHSKALTDDNLQYRIIDMQNHAYEHGIANVTLDIIKEHLALKQQVLVFINRRGFAPVLLCHDCGLIMDCSACDSHLTLHQHKLICHHCGKNIIKPKCCVKCASPNLVPVGIGTQRVYEYLSTVLPETKMLRIDRDQMQKKRSFETFLQQMTEGETELIVGTQMLAKGHHFPKLSLVVILDIDASLHSPDFRALEHLGQLITQVAGRAGRAQVPGQVVLQTQTPKHALLNILVQQGYSALVKALLVLRQEAILPPFAYLTLIRAEHKVLAKPMALLQIIKNFLAEQGLYVLGPAPAPLARKAGMQRLQILVKSNDRNRMNLALTKLRTMLTSKRLVSNIHLSIDVDPCDLS
jgi:primosomal protein N' (replication factor Y) (superfamily II helicase)